MEIKKEINGDTAFIFVSGEVDSANVGEFEEELFAAAEGMPSRSETSTRRSWISLM